MIETGSQGSKVGIIIRYTKNISDIEFIEAEYMKEKEKYKNYFMPKKEAPIREKEKIINKIVELNEKKNFNYYILKTPIQILDDLGLSDYLKEKIEFIDFPGYGSLENSFIKEEIKKLLEKQQAFIFVQDGTEFDENDKYELISLIYDETIKKKLFDINNCLFLFTHAKKNKNDGDDYEMENLKASLINVFERQTKNQCLLKKKKMKNILMKIN